MGASIPASRIVRVNPSVIAAGGSGLDLIGLFLTNNARVPVGTVRRFASAVDVAAFFGPLSTEATLAATYFAGYDGSAIKPAALDFVQYPADAVPAYLRGGALGSLASLQALSGTITLNIDGRTVTSGTISLNGASSYSNAASIIQTALNDQDATVTGSISGTTLTVTGVTSGTVAVGQSVGGASAGTVITALGTGTGGNGTYTVNNSQTVASGTLKLGVTTVTFDPVAQALVITAGTPGAGGTIGFATGGLAAPLALTAATGAETSQGADASTPAAAMLAVTNVTQDFASFATVFKPSAADMLAFAGWTDAQNDRFLYVMWDNDVAPTTSSDATSVGYQITQAGLSGTAPVYDPSNGAALAAFVMGAAASIDYGRTNGRTTLAFRSGSGLFAGVTNQTIAANLQANGYNFYGAYATANNGFTFLYPGVVSGPFEYLDTYLDQIWMNAGFQSSLLQLLVSAGSVPYNEDGYALIEASMLDQINRAVDFGAIRAGVTLSALQAAEVDAAAGRKVSDTIQERGWYALALAAPPEVRAVRGSPPVYFWYTDGQSVQSIILSSVLVQ